MAIVQRTGIEKCHGAQHVSAAGTAAAHTETQTASLLKRFPATLNPPLPPPPAKLCAASAEESLPLVVTAPEFVSEAFPLRAAGRSVSADGKSAACCADVARNAEAAVTAAATDTLRENAAGKQLRPLKSLRCS